MIAVRTNYDCSSLQVVGKNTVFRQPRKTWYQRHSGQILVGAFTAIGGVIGSVFTHFLTK